MRLSGKVCVVTGASKGIGRAIADAMLGEGASVVYCSRSKAVEACAEQAWSRTGLSVEPDRIAAVRADVSVRGDVRTLVQHAVDRFGRIHVLVNNAGINMPMRFLDVTDESWHEIMRTNALSVLLCSQEVGSRMISAGVQGSVINITSIGARQGYENVAPYCASKFAVSALTQASAIAFARHGIRVNSLAPGVVDTPMWEQVDQDMQRLGETSRPGEAFERISSETLIGRAAMPDEIGRVAVFLASDEARYITGQTIMADGGMVLV